MQRKNSFLPAAHQQLSPALVPPTTQGRLLGVRGPWRWSGIILSSYEKHVLLYPLQPQPHPTLCRGAGWSQSPRSSEGLLDGGGERGAWGRVQGTYATRRRGRARSVGQGPGDACHTEPARSQDRRSGALPSGQHLEYVEVAGMPEGSAAAWVLAGNRSLEPPTVSLVRDHLQRGGHRAGRPEGSGAVGGGGNPEREPWPPGTRDMRGTSRRREQREGGTCCAEPSSHPCAHGTDGARAGEWHRR